MSRNPMSVVGLWGGVLSLGVLGASLFSGCNLLEDNAQYLATVGAEVVFINIPTESLEPYGVNAPPTVALTVALGRIKEPETLSSNPFDGEAVTGAAVKIVTPEGTFDLKSSESAPGMYTLTSLEEAGLKYTEGADYSINIDFGGASYWIKMKPAGAVTLESPAEMGEYHEPGTPLTVRWSPASDNALATVFDSEGNQVYDNLPKDLNGLYQFLTAEEVSSLDIPGSVFGDSYAYGIAIAGMERKAADTATFSTNLNHLFSNTVTGNAVVTAVATVEIPDIPTEP